ncbi:hypothetical protein [Flagellimonas sp. S3867]|uniref:hypothetical protein n=1 Tax=Flagellimonas sp. S3867 TaxID=2768063 RepID=UPI0016897037|nr:hypothetical protein [Flagellimonas sp. S3867]
MKKIILPFCFIALISIGLLSMNKFPPKFNFSEVLDQKKSKATEHSIKYSDCIEMAEISKFTAQDTDVQVIRGDVLFDEINLCLEKYQRSLDSTVKNLNTIDAHKFLHSEFLRCKNQLNSDSLSVIKAYYHKGIMSLCYDRDKALNSKSVGRVAKR